VVRMLDGRMGRPASLWAEMARGVYRIYYAMDHALQRFLGRNGS